MGLGIVLGCVKVTQERLSMLQLIFVRIYSFNYLFHLSVSYVVRPKLANDATNVRLCLYRILETKLRVFCSTASFRGALQLPILTPCT